MSTKESTIAAIKDNLDSCDILTLDLILKIIRESINEK